MTFGWQLFLWYSSQQISRLTTTGLVEWTTNTHLIPILRNTETDLRFMIKPLPHSPHLATASSRHLTIWCTKCQWYISHLQWNLPLCITETILTNPFTPHLFLLSYSLPASLTPPSLPFRLPFSLSPLLLPFLSPFSSFLPPPNHTHIFRGPQSHMQSCSHLYNHI